MSNCFVFFSFSFQKQNAYNIVIIILPDSERFYIKALRKHRILHVFFPTENHCEHVNFYILRSPVACLSELWSSCRGPGQAPPPHHSIHTSSTRNSGTLVRTALGTSLLIWDANGHRTPEFMLHSLNSLPEVVLLPPSPIHRKAPSYLHLLSSLSPTTQPPDLILRS